MFASPFAALWGNFAGPIELSEILKQLSRSSSGEVAGTGDRKIKEGVINLIESFQGPFVVTTTYIVGYISTCAAV